MNKLGTALESFILRLEQTPMTFIGGVAAFAGIILVKAVLENFANGTITGIVTADLSDLVHYFLWFAGSYLSLVLVTYLFTRQPIAKISAFLLFVHLLIWLTAIIDLVIFQGNAHKLSYIYLGPKDLVSNWLALGSRYSGVGLGQMIIIPAVVVSSMAYCLIKTKALFKTIFVGLFSYTAIFLWGAFPSVAKIILDLLHGKFFLNATNDSVVKFFAESTNNSVLLRNLPSPNLGTLGINPQISIQINLLSELFFVAVAIQLLLWAYFRNKQQFKAVIGNVRFFGITHYYLSIGIGLALAIASPLLVHNWIFWLNLILLFLSFYFAYMFAMGTNDIADLEIDKVTNSDRPLTLNKISKEDLSGFNFAFLILALLAGFLSGPVTFYLVLIAIAISYIYSVNPLRLKRVPVLSTFLIALVSLTAVLAGFYFLNFNHSISDFPLSYLFAILAFHTVWGNIKDLKDREGDRAGGIATFANILDLRSSKKLIALFSAIGYLIVPFLIKEPIMFWLAVPAAAATAVLVMREKYSHYSVFFVYFAFLIFGFFLLA
ncbi:MAG: UbiA family prenyltransferase [Acidobacteriaceae bacterium]